MTYNYYFFLVSAFHRLERFQMLYTELIEDVLRGLSQFLGKKFIIEDRNLKVSI